MPGIFICIGCGGDVEGVGVDCGAGASVPGVAFISPPAKIIAVLENMSAIIEASSAMLLNCIILSVSQMLSLAGATSRQQ